jgi:two-component system, chemotaxis family, sensor kinase CheA
MSEQSMPQDRPDLENNQASHSEHVAADAALTEVARHVDLIHTSLVGMTAIILMLLAAVALPVFHYAPVTNTVAFGVMVAASLAGIGYLYYMNYRVHQHVSNQARLTEVLVNSLGQGFLSFDNTGLCGRVYSQACLDLLETIPARQNIKDVLRIPKDQQADFEDWMEVLFMPNHALGFDDVVKFLPQIFPHTKGRRVNLMYRPIRSKSNLLTHVVVIATDQTEEFEAQKRVHQQKNYADMICQIFKERNQFLATLTHIRKFIEAAGQPVRREDAGALLRLLHTLKAAVRHFHLENLGDIIHQTEANLRSDSIKTDADFQRYLSESKKEIEEALRDVLNYVYDLIGQDYEGRGNMHEVEESALYDFAHQLKVQNVDPTLLRRFLTTIVALPAKECFRQFERELRDLSEITGRQVKPVRYTGSNPRVLTHSIQDFLFSLTHVCRNIIDHGIEPPVSRLARGKDPAGQVSIHTDIVLDEENKREMLQIIISDDGNGVDPSRVRAKLAMIDPQGSWRQEDDQTVIQHIFSWGFSTNENVTNLSGRGVGMEAVEREVKLLGGSIKVYSELYHGARFDIRLPYTLELDEKDLLM